MKKIVASNVVASQPPNSDRLQRRPLVPIFSVYKFFIEHPKKIFGSNFLSTFALCFDLLDILAAQF